MKILHSTICITLVCLFMNPNDSIGQVTIDFDDFANILLMNSDDRKDKGSGTSSQSGNNSGGSDSGVGLTLHLGNTNVFLPKTYNISWVNETGPYEVIVGEDALLNSAIIFKAEVSSSNIEIPFGDLNLSPDKQYFVQIKSADTKSKKALFTLGSMQSFKDIVSNLKTEESFKRSSSFDKKLMKAFVLEKNGYNLEAAKIYMQYLVDDKQDMILRNMKDRFEERVGI